MRNSVWWLALACLAAGCSPPAPRALLQADDLREQVRVLESISAEAKVLAQQRAAGSVTAAFAWVHQQALAGESARAAEALARPTTESLRPAQGQALQLAAQLQGQVNRVAQAGAQAGPLADLAHAFAALQSQSAALEHRL
jgi:hypothetical protein